MDNSMIAQNAKIMIAHLNRNEAEKITAIKELLSLPEDKVFDKSEFKFRGQVFNLYFLDRNKKYDLYSAALKVVNRR